MFELEEGNYLYLLFLLPFLGALFLYVQVWKRKKQAEFGDLELVKKLSPNKSVFKPALKFFLIVLGLVFLIIGLANPKMGTKMETVKNNGIDIVFAIDVSKSMLAEDVAPNRLEKSKQLISQIINTLGNDRIGIIAYSGSAFPVLPITTDYSVAKMFLQGINPGIISTQGTSLDQAIYLSTTFFGKKDKTNKLLILISDGEDHSNNAIDAAEDAQKLGLKMITIGVGTEKGAPIPLKENASIIGYQKDKNDQVVITKRNAQILQEIGKLSKGYVDGNNTKNVVDYIKNTVNTIEKTDYDSSQMANFKSQFQWLLGIGIFLLFLDIFLLERKTKWVKKMNLFNEEKSENQL